MYKQGYFFQNRLLYVLMKGMEWLSQSKPLPIPKDPKRILLAHFAHFGDLVLATALLPALKKRYPQATLDFLCNEETKELLEGHPLIHHLYTMSHWYLSKEKTKAPLDRYQILRRLKKKNYDIGIDLYGFFPNASLFLKQAKIPIRIGFTSGGMQSLYTHPIPWNRTEKNWIHAYQKIGAILTCESSLIYPYLGWEAKDPLHGSPYFLFHIGSRGSHKEWPMQHWIVLARWVAKEQKQLLFFTGKGVEDQKKINTILEHVPEAISLCNQLSLRQLYSYIAHATAIVTIDSLVSHLASVANVPTMTLYSGISDYRMWHWGKQTTPLIYKKECVPCFQKKGCKTMECIRNVTPFQVIQELKKHDDPSLSLC